MDQSARASRPSVTLHEALYAALPSGSRVVGGALGLGRYVTWAQTLSGRPVSLSAIEPGELVILSASAPALYGGEVGVARLLGDLAQAGANAFAVVQAAGPILAGAIE